MVGSPLASAHRLRDHLPHITCKNLKSKLSRQYSAIPFDSHATQAFTHLQQCSDDLLEMYLYHAREFVLKIHCMTSMSEILAVGLNCYTMVFGLNSNKLKDKVVGHQIASWKTMEDCFSDIHTFGAGYERAKGYCRADSDTPEALVISEVKSMKEPGPCFTCFHSISRKHEGHHNNKVQSYKKINNPNQFCQIEHTIGQSLQVPYPFRHHNQSRQVMTFLWVWTQ